VNQVKVCRFYNYSSEYGDMTPPNKRRLKENLENYQKNKIYIAMILKIERNVSFNCGLFFI